MSDVVLRFFPWMKRGLGRALASEANAHGVPKSAIAAVNASITVASREKTRSIQVLGPGAVIGLSGGQVIREEPKPNTTNFETNYFPFVELVSPDLPWMFTPAVTKSDKLIPWLVLVVVEDRDGVTMKSAGSRPLPSVQIDDATRELPSLEEAWAWAHVQASVTFGGTSPQTPQGRDTFTGDVEDAFDATPEAFTARLMCPRKLAERTYYYACLVPSFEQGRLAGLGQDPSTADATKLAWGDRTKSIELPVYHSFRFRTVSEGGDFESLVKALTARTLSGSAGVHDLDVGDPGTSRLPNAPGTIVGYTGALVSPNVEVPAWPADHKAAFQPAMQTILNESLVREDKGGKYDWRTDDPVVAPPAYGALAAGVDEVPAAGTPASEEAPLWLSDVNLDPAKRAAAGAGAEAVRRNQESLMASAWEQVEGIGAVNRALNQACLALQAGALQKARIDAWEDGALVQLSRGAHPRLKKSTMDTTLHGRLMECELPNGLVSGAFRRRVRPGTTVARAAESSAIASSVTEAFIASPAKKLDYATLNVPFGTVFDDGTKATSKVPNTNVLVHAIDHSALAVKSLSGAVARTASKRRSQRRLALSREGRGKRATSTAMSMDPGVMEPGWVVSSIPVALDLGGEDALDLTAMASLVRDKLSPSALIGARVRALVPVVTTTAIPASLSADPSFPEPLYELVAKIDPELLLPGVGDIPDNTVALAEVNAAFVEAALLGANHELVRELLWREYPADPAGTYLRTFWGSVEGDVEDIAPVATWGTGTLGTHQAAMDPSKVLVLILKGELLRRYPNTLVYAVEGEWATNDEGDDERVEREGGEVEQPIFVGSLGDGVTFMGFQFDADIDVERDVKGSTKRSDGRPGWFFVFEEPATGLRFGLDVGRDNQAGQTPRYWKNVSWVHALGVAASSSPATHAPLGTLNGVVKAFDDQGENTWTETWGRSAAAMARITLQRPVRMLVHADQMLEAEGE